MSAKFEFTATVPDSVAGWSVGEHAASEIDNIISRVSIFMILFRRLLTYSVSCKLN